MSDWYPFHPAEIDDGIYWLLYLDKISTKEGTQYRPRVYLAEIRFDDRDDDMAADDEINYTIRDLQRDQIRDKQPDDDFRLCYVKPVPWFIDLPNDLLAECQRR